MISTTRHRIHFCPREKASYIMLRRQGYSINILSRAFGRSTSIIHKILKRAHVRTNDLRKLPPRIRRLASARQWNTIMKLQSQWEAFMLGEGEKPP